MEPATPERVGRTMKKILLWFFSVGVGVFVVLFIIDSVVDDSDQSSNDTGDLIWMSPEQKKKFVKN